MLPEGLQRDVIKNLKLYGEMHRFIPAVASWYGVRVAEVETVHHPRMHGKSKYGISRTIKVVLDLITVKFLQSFSTKPIQFFGPSGSERVPRLSYIVLPERRQDLFRAGYRREAPAPCWAHF